MAYADNLMSSTQNFMTPDFFNKASAMIGQPVDKIQSGLKSVIPTFLMGLVNKGSSTQGANSIVNLVNSNDLTTPATPSNITDPEYVHKGENVLNGIFGSNLNSVTSTLGKTTGLGAGSITKLLSLIAPMVMGVVGSKIKSENLNARGVQNFFSQQKSNISGFIPGGLTGMMGLGSVPNVTQTHAFRAGTVDSNRKGVLWALIAFIILGIFGAGYWVMSSRQTLNVSSPQAKGKIDRPFNSSIITQPAKTAASVAAPASLGELGAFLKSGNTSELPKRFQFENLNFATGTATLGTGSGAELDQITEALKQYPNATARIEGFTDNTGNAASNQKLSELRAETVKSELISRGINAERLTVVGRGQDAPLVPNDNSSHMAMNRRIEFILTGIK